MPIETLLARMLLSGSKSTVLKALLSLDVLTLTGMVYTVVPWSAKGAAPIWVTIWLAVLFTLSFVATIWAYIYFALRDPNLLRSEQYNLKKFEIEKGISGDSESGYSEGRPLLKRANSAPLVEISPSLPGEEQ